MNTLTAPGYRPEHLLDVLQDKLDVSSDAKLAAHLGVAPPVISKIRNKQLEIGPTLLVRLSEEMGLPIAALRELAGLPRRMYIDA